MNTAIAPSYDVVILGGGLAGLTLALHLKQVRPQTSVLVLEKRGHRLVERHQLALVAALGF